jgi:hypothetical protein
MDRNMERGYTLIHLEKFIKDYGKRINWWKSLITRLKKKCQSNE